MKRKAVVTFMAFALMTSVAVELFGQKTKKIKDKRFETVVRQDLKDYEGTYVGIDSDYIIDVRVRTDGSLLVTSLEAGRSVTLNDIKVTGARLTGVKIYANGESEKFEGTFSDRILNGKRAFGIVVEGLNLHLDGGTTLNKVFYQRH